MKHNLELKTDIHNRFDIEVKDIRTGEVREKYQAENIVLNQMWSRLCNRSAYFVNIHFGTGTGTLDPARTSLFAHLGTKAAADDAMSKVLPTSWWRRKIVLNPEEYEGSELTEVGIAYGSTPTNLVTHAQIRDMNGNITSIVKTAYDVITIYATVFVTFSTSDASLSITGLAPSCTNFLINYLIGGTAWPSSTYFYSGRVDLESTEFTRTVLDANPSATSALTWTADAPNKKMTSNVARYGIDQANMDIIEIGLGSSRATPMLRLHLDSSSVYSGLSLEGVPVGTGDDTEVRFVLPSRRVKDATLVVKIDGTATTAFTKTVEARNDVINYARLEDNIDYATQMYIADASDDGSIILVLPFSNGLETPVNIWGIYDFDGARFVRRTEQPAILSSIPIRNIGNLSSDGSTVVLARTDSAGFYSYDWNGTTWDSRTTAPGIVGGMKNLSLSNDGNTVAYHCGYESPYVRVYDWDSENSVWIARATPPSIAHDIYASGLWVALSGNGLVLAHGYGYYDRGDVRVYDWNGSNWTQRANPTLGASSKYMSFTDHSLSYDGSAFAYSCSGVKTVAIWSGSAWTYRDFDAIGLNYGTYTQLSQDGLTIAGCDSTSGYIAKWYNDQWHVVSTVAGSYRGALSQNPQQFFISSATAFSVFITIYDMSPEQEVITFTTPPADGAVITADYTVNGIHKTAQRVIDLQATIQFGEPV